MERFKDEDVNKLRACLEHKEETIVVVPHINADGDATGSVFGLWRVLTNSGHTVKVITPNSYAGYYNWMCGHQDAYIFNRQTETSAKILEKAGILICMDFNQPSRAGDMEKLIINFKGTKILIDHHPDPADFADIVFSDTRRSSTAELAFALLNAAGFGEYIDKDAASCFYAGIMTDTGSFNYSVSDPETFRTISKLIEYGIDQNRIHTAIYDNFSEERMRLLGHCLHNRMKVFPDYHTAYIYLTKEDQKEFNFKKGDSEGFVNYPLSIKGIHFSAFFSENDDHVKVSFRSKGKFPVNRFSEENYNGGGHVNAAGGEIYVSLQEAIDKFETLLPDYKKQLDESDPGKQEQ